MKVSDFIMHCGECEYAFFSKEVCARCENCGETVKAPELSDCHGEQLVDTVENMEEIDDYNLRMVLAGLWWFDDTKETFQACWRYLSPLVKNIFEETNPKIEFAVSALENYFADLEYMFDQQVETPIRGDASPRSRAAVPRIAPC